MRIMWTEPVELERNLHQLDLSELRRLSLPMQ